MPNEPDDTTTWRDETTVGRSINITRLQRGKTPHWLEQIEGPGSPREFALVDKECVIGRSVEASISVNSSLLSRRHVLLSMREFDIHCQDLDSANGVFLNGIKFYSATLRDADTIQAGDVVFIFHEGSQ